MNKLKFLIVFAIAASPLLNPIGMLAQCVRINEVLINGPGACDGMCSPNTEEWTELYNTCSTPVNIGCFVLTDGDFIVSIPQGTMIAAHGFYVIGSVNSPGPAVDLDLGTCNCVNSVGANQIGILNNTSEQLVLANSAGALQDAIYWGSGNFPLSISSNLASCPTIVNINLTTINSWFSLLPTPGSDGCSVARKCDGSPTWQQRCGTQISQGASNGAPPIAQFVASDSIICPGTCINFNNLSIATGATWNWSFAGAQTSNSLVQNPNSICYNTVGNYTVTMVLTNVCGAFPVTKTAYIQVGNIPAPIISASGPLSICSGTSVVLQSSAGATYQWFLNNVALTGATQQQYTATVAGNYKVRVLVGICSSTSAISTVVINPKPIATATASGPTTICNSGTTQLDAGLGFSSYQWLSAGTIIPGETNPSLTANASGNYTVIVSDANGCKDTSSAITINFSTGYSVSILADKTFFCEGESANLSLNGTFPIVAWSTGESTSTIAVTKTGKYKVIVSNTAGCSGKDSVFIQVTPLPLVNAGIDTLGDCSNGILLHGSSSGTQFLWSPADALSDPTIPNPVATPKETTQYVLTVADNNCFSSDEVIITIDCGDMYIPNSFSPNGDGNNDVFLPVGNNIGNFEMRIYDRWGELVFESKLASVGWDGNYLNQPAASGVYIREIKAFNPLGKPLVNDSHTHGIITLFR